MVEILTLDPTTTTAVDNQLAANNMTTGGGYDVILAGSVTVPAGIVATLVESQYGNHYKVVVATGKGPLGAKFPTALLTIAADGSATVTAATVMDLRGGVIEGATRRDPDRSYYAFCPVGKKPNKADYKV